MCSSCDIQIDGVWSRLHINQTYVTPDEKRGTIFRKTSIDDKTLKISPQNIFIKRFAFSAVLHYLRKNRHDHTNPCRIGSNKDPAFSSPLCLVAREKNNNVMCINYILSVLDTLKIVDINGSRPNTAWVLRCSE